MQTNDVRYGMYIIIVRGFYQGQKARVTEPLHDGLFVCVIDGHNHVTKINCEDFELEQERLSVVVWND